MSVMLPNEHNFGFVSLTERCTGSSESTHVEMPHCWKSHVTAQMHITVLTNHYGEIYNFNTMASHIHNENRVISFSRRGGSENLF